jgi:SET domain-containing protein
MPRTFREPTPFVSSCAVKSNKHHNGQNGQNGHPLLERRRSRIAGWGVYATQPINKNKRIVTYDGEKITNKESLGREERYLEKGCIWCFRLNRQYVRDAAVGGNIARFINHSCKPNCYTTVIDQTIWVIASRNIRKGEELTYNYMTEGVASIPCKCRPGCKTML